MPAFWRRDPGAAVDPGEQSASLRNWLDAWYLWLLVAVLLVLAAQAFVQANFVTPRSGHGAFWRLKILDVNNAVTALLTLLGLLGVRGQLILGTRPILSYAGQYSAVASGRLEPGDARTGTWQTLLRNVGSGPALIVAATYSARLHGAAESRAAGPAARARTYADALAALEAAGLVEGRDYALTRVSAGATLGAGESVPLFEALPGAGATIAALDVAVTFRGLLGDRFVKVVYCVPRGGIRRPSGTPPVPAPHPAVRPPADARGAEVAARRTPGRPPSSPLPK